MDEREKALKAREEAVAAKEREIEERARALDPFSLAVDTKKRQWYDRVTLNVRQMDRIILVVSILLGIVILLITLEATGVFTLKLF